MGGLEYLRVRLLGGLAIDGLDERALGSRKARTLVKLLALGHNAPVRADRIVDVLWADGDAPAKPAEQVGVLVSRLRGVLGADRLTRTDAGWTLAVDWLDVTELAARVDEAAARLESGQPAAARAAAEAALALVRGELLADEPDPTWAETDRAAIDRTVARARLIAADAAITAGDPKDAASVAEGALDHDPYDEAALRLLMRAHAAAGRPASALAAYARMRQRLAEDLGVDPDRATEELHTAILLGDQETSEPDARTGTPRSAFDLAGRDAELAKLDGLLRRADAGDVVLAVVEGEAGIGKTALMNTWAAARRTDALVLRGQCDELGRDLPLQPLLDGLEEHLRSLDQSAADELLADAEPVLGPLLGRFTGQPAGGPTTVTEPAAGQALLFASLLAVVGRAAGDLPAVVIVDDVHLAGTSTVEWLRFAARRGRRLLVIATTRPEGPNLRPAEIITLGPLDVDAARALVGDERAAALHARSGGHPLFLLELAAAEGDEMPANIREAVARRVDGLGEAATTLRTMAVLGAEVDVDLLAGVVKAPVAALLAHIDAGIRAQVIEERGAQLAFRHELVREALIAGTTASRRAYVHRTGAEVLRDRADHDPLEVAWHARLGGDTDTAVGALVSGAAVAAARFDTTQAAQLLDDAIGLRDTAEARLARARVRISCLDPSGAEHDALRALELGGDAEALEAAGWAAYYARDYGLAGERADEAAARSKGGDPDLRASCLTLSGRIRHSSGQLGDADERLTEAVATASPTARGVAQVFLGSLRVHQGRVDEGRTLVDRALLDPRRMTHPSAIHHAHFSRVLACGMMGRPVDAFSALAQGRAAETTTGEHKGRFLLAYDNIESWLLRNLGHLEQAEERTTGALETATGQPLMREMYYAGRLDLAQGQLLCGDLGAAAASLDATTDVHTWVGTQAWHHRQRFAVLSAEVALLGGEPDVAAELATAVIADAEARGSLRYGALASVVAARAACAQGEPVDHELVEAALRDLDRCAGLEGWRVTAEMAAATGVDRWWRDAERRAGALVANAGEHAESLRRWIGSVFAGLGR